jgi:hypothetical protein
MVSGSVTKSAQFLPIMNGILMETAKSERSRYKFAKLAYT